MRNLWLISFGILLAALTLPAQVKVTYLANEGVMLSAGQSKVLVDALFRDSLEDYARHDAATQERLETGKPPFDGVSLALATHYHLDHWDAGAISRFLSSNPKALFASTPQAVGMIPSSLKPRVRGLWPGGGAGTSVTAGEVAVEALPLRHGATENLGYRISMGGRVLVHIGDADAEKGNFDALLAKGSPDVAMVPFWWLLGRESIQFIRERWKPRAVVAIHFGAADASTSSAKVRSNFPEAWVCIKSGEFRAY